MGFFFLPKASSIYLFGLMNGSAVIVSSASHPTKKKKKNELNSKISNFE